MLAWKEERKKEKRRHRTLHNINFYDYMTDGNGDVDGFHSFKTDCFLSTTPSILYLVIKLTKCCEKNIFSSVSLNNDLLSANRELFLIRSLLNYNYCLLSVNELGWELKERKLESE